MMAPLSRCSSRPGAPELAQCVAGWVYVTADGRLLLLEWGWDCVFDPALDFKGAFACWSRARSVAPRC